MNKTSAETLAKDIFNFAMQHGVPELNDPEGLRRFQEALMLASGNWKSLEQAAETVEKQATPEISQQVQLVESMPEKPRQASMFDTLQKRSEEAKQREEAKRSKEAAQPSPETSTADNPNLDPVRHHQTDFFVCDLVDYAFKDDQASMEAPIFSLSTREDMKLWTWTSEDGKKSVEVAPGFYGRATQHDKDILIYCASHLTEAINQGKAASKTVRFTAYDFLVATNRDTASGNYTRLKDALNRLRGMQINTNIITGKNRVTEGFGVIDKWRVVEKSPDNNRMVAVEVTLSDWLYNSIQAHEVLTIHPDYFRLRKPLERRLYEIARKHVGKQGVWKIGLSVLHSKSGSADVLRNFKVKLKEIIEADTIPGYRYQLGGDDLVTIYDRDPKAVVRALI